VEPIGDIALTIKPAVASDDGEWLLSGDWATFSWELEGETDSVEAVLLKNGEYMRKVGNGDRLKTSLFKEGMSYEFRVTAMPKNGTVMNAEPTVRSAAFRQTPQVIPLEGIELSVEPRKPDGDDMLYIDRDAEQVTVSWNVLAAQAEDAPTPAPIEGAEAEAAVELDAVSGELLEDGELIASNLRSGDSFDRALLSDGHVYTLRVKAVPKNGTLLKVEPTVETLDFAIYPQPEPIVGFAMEVSGGTPGENGGYQLSGNTANLSWCCESDNVDHYELAVTDQQGSAVEAQTFGAGQTAYTLTMQKRGDYTLKLTAVPRYGTAADGVFGTAVVTPHIPTFLEKYWYFLAGAAALLLAGVAVLLIYLKEKNTKHVVGNLRVVCEALGLDKTMAFQDDRKGVKLDDPLTKHPQLARLKGKKAYELLSQVHVGNAVTDQNGKGPNEGGEVVHRAKVRVVSLTYANPSTLKQEYRYVGMYDPEPSTLRLSDAGKEYDFTFTWK